VVGCVVQCTDSWDTFFVDAVDAVQTFKCSIDTIPSK
jgi:hypothetical protein